MEILDLYDSNRIKTDKTHVRGEKVPEGFYRIVARVIVLNENNQILIQKRQDTKGRKSWDNYWDFSAAGSVSSGETSQQAVERELKEELGLEHDFTNTRPASTINFFEGFEDFYIIRKPMRDIKKVVLQQEEVSEVRWASKIEILKMMESGEFIPWNKDILNLIFSIEGKWSSFDI
ncbi:NUDIX hydrolase [[Acholeplasma] multilocale]|uniref:NUDIX hydrolase n=1 Tax=[Acholeplasma] multilocale TaxID=264638 RepID=UPI00047E0E39|nr:NUDIX domain-containing protein [[Acholeplasma] multilocale]